MTTTSVVLSLNVQKIRIMRRQNVGRCLILTIIREVMKVIQIVKTQALMKVVTIAKGEAVTGLGALGIDVKCAEEAQIIWAHNGVSTPKMATMADLLISNFLGMVMG